MASELEENIDFTVEPIKEEAATVHANPLEFFGFDSDEIDEVFKENEIEAVIRRDKRVCSCGHPIKKHENIEHVGWLCKPGRQQCRCSEPYAVISVWDTRYFMRKSVGNGGRHALALGIRASMDADPTKNDLLQWLIPTTCQACGTENVKLYPMNMTDQGVIKEESAYKTKLLCDGCAYGQATVLREFPVNRPELNQ
jgi:hypothetical protein